MYTVYVGLGSNLGNRMENLQRALAELGKIASITAISSVYETEPVGMEDAGPFLNMVAGFQTEDDPPLLLVKLKSIERKIGRRAHAHMEPRIIDLDILLYRGLAYEHHTVRVPHPMLEHRRFSLEPLHEIAPTAVHPTLEKTIASLTRQCRDRHSVVRTDLQVQLIPSHSS